DTTETGDFSECGEKDARDLRFLTLRASSDPQFCSHRGCTPDSGCFYKKARKEAADADLLVVNHALLAIELFQDGRLLPSFESLIIDEAHAFLTTSLDHLTLRVGVRRLRGIKERMPGPSAPTFLKEGEGEARWKAVMRAVKGLEACEPYFGAANGKKPGGDPRQTFETAEEIDHLCPAGFRKVVHGLGTLDADIAVLENHMSSHPEADHPHALGFAAGLSRFRDEVVSARQDLDQLLNPDENDRDVVHWKEWSGEHFDLCRSPLEVGPHLTPALMRGPTRVVFTSATLATGEDFGFFSRETGLGERLHAVAYPSPFAYEEQSAVIALKNGPDPRDSNFPKSTAKVLGDLVHEPNRKTLALFTSYRDLNQTHKALRDHPALQESTILAQGEGQSPAELLERFRDLPHGVLLGTASFWQGIDLPGDALEILVITRLPFGVPTDPRLKARSERVEAAGGNAFMDLYLPEAVLKFKQGFGRLIRRRSDRGVVLVLDPRFLGKGYGRRFAKALPVPVQEALSVDELVEKTRRWWATGTLETEKTR
ncbi:MAG: hypothetical protein HKN21_16635, partial [Candidatus Eisenbacteria bacterium]|nr:hypothetical protein [Candidatus Eisenbacteria bacterium]